MEPNKIRYVKFGFGLFEIGFNRDVFGINFFNKYSYNNVHGLEKVEEDENGNYFFTKLFKKKLKTLEN